MKMRILFFMMVTALFFVQISSPCQNAGTQAREEIVKKSIQQYDAGRYAEAYDLLAPLAKEKKADEVVYFYLGMIACKGSNYEAAEKCFKNAISINPNYASPYSDLSAVLLLKKKYEEAEKAAVMAVKLDPKYAIGFANLGMAQLALNKKKEARVNFSKAAGLEPSTITNCGVDMLLKENDPEAALYFFGISLEAEPDQPVVLFNSGQAYKMLGEERKALDMFKKAYDITKPGDKPFGLVYGGYFRQLLDMGDYDAIFKTGLSRVGADYPGGYLFRALAYYKMERKAEFEKAAKKYFELSGEEMPASLDKWAKDNAAGTKTK